MVFRNVACNRRSIASVIAVALVSTLTGCGGGDSSSSTSTATTSSSTSSPTPTPTSTATTISVSTASVLCPYSGTHSGTYSKIVLTAQWDWSCDATTRTLSGNGLPDHAVGSFPNSGNPNSITAQAVNATMTLTPTLASSDTELGGSKTIAYALNSVKFDPATAGTCDSSATSASGCALDGGSGTWKIEALGQSVFDFGVDSNNAHVQPSGAYHYHGMPEGILTNAGVSDTNRKMLLVGWAADGFPVYARYCYTDAMDATSSLKVCTGSYVKDSTPDAGRPSTSWVPLGAFTSDWSYSAGSGDLDECNGRTGVTPEFPDGIYYYMVTDSYPYFSRCLRGNL